jgi:hypothetical protein
VTEILQNEEEIDLRSFRIMGTVLFLFLMVQESSAVIFGIRYSNLSEPLLPAIERQESRGRLGIFAGTRQKSNDFLIGLDYDRYKQQRGDTLLYSRRITVSMGYRYRLFSTERMEAMKIVPTVGVHLFKSFASVNADSSIFSEQDRTYYKDISNDEGLRVAFSVEYFFAPAFSFGCEGGIQYIRAKSKAYGYTIKVSEYRTYAAILISFYW